MEKPIVFDKQLEVKIEGTQTVKNNMSEIKDKAIEIRDHYANLVFNEDQVKEASSERANINKMIKTIDDNRKLIVAQYNKPLDEFVNLAKETVSILKEASGSIDAQVKKYEAEEKNIKLNKCKEIYEDKIGDLKDIVPFEKLYNPKWLNKGTKFDEIEKSIEENVERINSGISAIKELNSEFETEVTNVFLQDFDLSKAIMKNTELKEQKAYFEKQKETKEEKEPEEVKEPVAEEKTDDPVEEYALLLCGKRSDLVKIANQMKVLNISYKKLKNYEVE